jgi:hypothetical protein
MLTDWKVRQEATIKDRRRRDPRHFFKKGIYIFEI